MSALRWLAEYANGDEVTFRIGRDGDDLVAEWIGLARLVARRDGSGARLERAPDADERELTKIERGSARLLLRHLEGRLAFHGAAVALEGRALVLLGRSGDGKSTLGAWLCAHAGAALFADDAVALDPALPAPAASRRDEDLGGEDSTGAARWQVAAGERDHWLDAAARAALGLSTSTSAASPAAAELAGSGVAADADEPDDKWPLPTLRAGEGTAELVAFVELAFADVESPRLVKLHDVDALAALIPQAVRFVLDEPALHRRELDSLVALVESVPVYKLERPRDLARLARTGELAAHILRGGKP